VTKTVLSIAAALMALFVATVPVAAQVQGSQYVGGTTGVDISWPNCSASIPQVTFGIVGVTYGQGYSTSPCIAQEVGHFSNRSLYVNTGWYDKSTHINPTYPRGCAPGDSNCLAYNYGYNAGLYAVNAAEGAGVATQTTWWLDVETGNTWNTNVLQNQNSLQGERDALVISGGATTVGVYSTTAQWQGITGAWKNNWPSWGATTWSTATQAQTYCTGHRFTGGPSYLMQYRPRNAKVDYDVAC
jgi:hypothetical protein